MKTALLTLAFSLTATSAAFVYVGRTAHSSPFQMDIPYGSAVKTTPDPANIWSWHHTFPGGGPTLAEVLVDVDGNNVMDTEHPWLRVVITDLAIVQVAGPQPATAWIRDGTGRRFAVSTAPGANSKAAEHVALATPIVLPVGSPLTVEVVTGNTCEVHLVGRVVNL